jgi:hypothetical protein
MFAGCTTNRARARFGTPTIIVLKLQPEARPALPSESKPNPETPKRCPAKAASTGKIDAGLKQRCRLEADGPSKTAHPLVRRV